MSIEFVTQFLRDCPKVNFSSSHRAFDKAVEQRQKTKEGVDLVADANAVWSASEALISRYYK